MLFNQIAKAKYLAKQNKNDVKSKVPQKRIKLLSGTKMRHEHLDLSGHEFLTNNPDKGVLLLEIMIRALDINFIYKYQYADGSTLALICRRLYNLVKKQTPSKIKYEWNDNKIKMTSDGLLIHDEVHQIYSGSMLDWKSLYPTISTDLYPTISTDLYPTISEETFVFPNNRRYGKAWQMFTKLLEEKQKCDDLCMCIRCYEKLIHDKLNSLNQNLKLQIKRIFKDIYGNKPIRGFIPYWTIVNDSFLLFDRIQSKILIKIDMKIDIN